MNTYIWFDREVASPLIVNIINACDKYIETGAYSSGRYALVNDILIQYNSNRIWCKFDHQIRKMPVELSDMSVTRVTLEAPCWSSHPLHEGFYKRKRATATVERNQQADGQPTWHVIVEAVTLRAANRLFDDIIRGIAVPRISHHREAVS